MRTAQLARELAVQPEIHELLGYDPNEEYLIAKLFDFEALVSRMTVDDISPEALRE